MALNKNNLNNLFFIFIISHLIIWTLIPTFTNHNLPLDTIEHLAWGSNLDWGFDKHPPLVAVFLEIQPLKVDAYQNPNLNYFPMPNVQWYLMGDYDL